MLILHRTLHIYIALIYIQHIVELRTQHYIASQPPSKHTFELNLWFAGFLFVFHFLSLSVSLHLPCRNISKFLFISSVCMFTTAVYCTNVFNFFVFSFLSFSLFLSLQLHIKHTYRDSAAHSSYMYVLCFFASVCISIHAITSETKHKRPHKKAFQESKTE